MPKSSSEGMSVGVEMPLKYSFLLNTIENGCCRLENR